MFSLNLYHHGETLQGQDTKVRHEGRGGSQKGATRDQGRASSQSNRKGHIEDLSSASSSAEATDTTHPERDLEISHHSTCTGQGDTQIRFENPPFHNGPNTQHRDIPPFLPKTAQWLPNSIILEDLCNTRYHLRPSDVKHHTSHFSRQADTPTLISRWDPTHTIPIFKVPLESDIVTSQPAPDYQSRLYRLGIFRHSPRCGSRSRLACRPRYFGNPPVSREQLANRQFLHVRQFHQLPGDEGV